MKFLHDIQAMQVSDDLTTETALMLVNKIVKKRNLGNLYLKSLTFNLPNVFNPVSATATPAASTLTFSFANQTAKTFLAAPIANNGTPTFRALTLADMQDFYTAVDKTQLNYWALSSSDVHRATGNVFIGHSASLGAYRLQVTGSIYNSVLLGATEAILKTSTLGVIARATGADIAALLGSSASSNYVQNQNATAQTGTFWINGNGSAPTFTAKNSTASTGSVSVISGNTTNAGYIEIRNTSNLRLGYIGWDNTQLAYVAENNASHVFTGGRVLVGNVLNGTKLLQVQGGIRQTDIISGLVFANAQGELQAATAANIADTLGAGNYIQNQYTAAQGANAWISGIFRAETRIESSRRGFVGTYNSAEVQGIWSISGGYLIDNSATNDFGSQYGLVYSHTGAGVALPNGTSTKKAITGWGHQILFTENGIVRSGISLSLGHTWQLGQAVFGNYSTTLYSSTSYSFINSNGVSYLANNLELGKTSLGGWLNFRRTSDGVYAGGLGFIDNNTINITSFGGAGIISFTTSSTEKMRITSGGKILMGTATETGNWRVMIDSGATTGDGLHVKGNIRATGNIIADGYFSGTSSDFRYKSNFQAVRVIDVIDNINVYSYNHKLYDNAILIGSIAQELQAYFPQLISEDANGYLRVDNYGYSALALQLGKEVKSELDLLKERVKELENKIQTLNTK
jgi:hypothetical protein